MWIAPTRYPHRQGRCYTQLGFGKLWKLGRKLHYAYRVSSVFKLVERSGMFWCYYNKEGEMIAFKSPATWRLMGSQTTLDPPPYPLPSASLGRGSDY